MKKSRTYENSVKMVLKNILFHFLKRDSAEEDLIFLREYQ